ncbi:MAG: bifunctional non-ous end joining protein LigD [Thermoleophilaceae bacterium]|jgi:bifunctional non-homologous end joining protein LigD|nr:bifunctional non-ous end joining protein LigD [Thermoleophilaceae bacterium]
MEVEVQGHQLKLSNLDKVMYPAAGFTKGHVIDYYTRIAPVMLGHLRDRPLTRIRYPNGVDDKFFYEKNCPDHRPDWVQVARIFTRGTGRWGRESRGPRDIDFCLANDLPTLIWLANLAALEMHTSLAVAEAYDRPTMVAFDLDPGPPATIVECCRVALILRGMFERLGLECFAKTSGSKGMQVYLPLNTPTSYDVTTPFARTVAELLEQNEPGLVVSEQSKELRTGKVLVDWSQNVDFKTTVCVYSLRARERPTVSTPLTWEEVEAARAPEDLRFEAPDVLERVERHGDLYAPVLELEQRLPAAMGG